MVPDVQGVPLGLEYKCSDERLMVDLWGVEPQSPTAFLVSSTTPYSIVSPEPGILGFYPGNYPLVSRRCCRGTAATIFCGYNTRLLKSLTWCRRSRREGEVGVADGVVGLYSALRFYEALSTSA